MRAFFFTNMYLSSIQNGIQSAHCLAEIYNTYITDEGTDDALFKYVTDWAENHKTIIVLNGGTGDDLRKLQVFFEDNANTFPWSYFHEPSLDNTKTCVGIILPEYIYETVTRVLNKTVSLASIALQGSIILDQFHLLSKWEVELISKLTTYQLAR